MKERICIVGLDPSEHEELQELLRIPLVIHDVIPKIVVQNNQLLVASNRRLGLLPVHAVVFHGIFEDDFDFITGLALWGGPCLPHAAAMMDCRLKFPCLVRALRHSRFAQPARGYVSPHTEVVAEVEHVAKWGNWHCGENKTRFVGPWNPDQASIIEPFLEGQSVRVVMIGERFWQIRLEGSNWLKSIHDPQAELMAVDPELLDDTRALQSAFGLELIANDYIVTNSGSKHLLEVNHIPNVSRFPVIWEAYRDYVVQWVENVLSTT
jgi:hypothetical protein